MQHITGPDAKGNFTVTYDDPLEDPHYGECGQSIEMQSGKVVLCVLPLKNIGKYDREVAGIIAHLHRLAAVALPADTV